MRRNLAGALVGVALLAAACSADPALAPPGDVAEPPQELPNFVPALPPPATTPVVPAVEDAPTQPAAPAPPAPAQPAPAPPAPSQPAPPALDEPDPAGSASVATDVRRSGEVCVLEFEPGTVRFEVPDNMWAVDCALIEYADPFPAGCCGIPLSVHLSPRSLWQVLQDVESAEDTSIQDVEWTSIGGRGAWLLDVRAVVHDRPDPYHERWLAMELGTQTLMVRASDLPAEVQPDQLRALHQELLDTLHVSTAVGTNAGTWNAPPDRWCLGDTWATPIPAGWFAFGGCGGTQQRVWLNTSPYQQQCDCPTPLWIARDWPALDYEETTVLSDVLEVQPDGTSLRVLEVKMEGGPGDGVDARVVIVPMPGSEIAVVANRVPTQRGPALTFDDTLAAQQEIVESLRAWGGPHCGLNQIVRTVRATPILTAAATGGLVDTAPKGTSLRATGCVEVRDGVEWWEVRTLRVTDSEAPSDQRPARGRNIVGWVDSDSMTRFRFAECPVGADTLEDDDAQISVVGDFDGDGLDDQAKLRGRDDGGPAEIAFFFANGAAAFGPLDTPDVGSVESVGQVLRVFRPVGMDRDVIMVNDPSQGGPYTSPNLIVGVEGCTPTVFGGVFAGASVMNQVGYCLAPTPFGIVMRSFTTRTGLHQMFAATNDEHLVWGGDQFEPLPEFGLGSEPLCGPRFEPELNPDKWSGPTGPLEGVHGLSLQWLGVDSSEWGEIVFRTVGSNRYQVTGRQGAAEGVDGDFLDIHGIIDQDGDGNLHFEGTITTRVGFLNEGQVCSRGGGQDFVATQGRTYLRMQDQINCDHHTTDYIDIYFG